MSFLTVPIAFLTFIIVYQFEHSLENLEGISLFSIAMFFYINKDFLKAKSPAKRILGYQIINIKTDEPANELQCFIRNLTLIAWPVELIIGFINPERRIGDFLANTKVITSKKENLKSIWYDFKKVELKRSFLLIIMIGILYFYSLNLILPL
jgi:uncharacterized RDD family membrane protein YckC